MIEPLVSIVMPSFNCQGFLHESIISVIEQTYCNWELIIVDDCSTDGSASIAQEYAAKDGRIRLFLMEKNAGPAAVRNKATHESHGQYIAFLDSDDLWVPQKLETQIKMMQERKALFSFSSYSPFRADGTPVSLVRAPETISYKKMLQGSVIGCLTVMYDTSVIGKRYFSEGREEIAGTLYARLIEKLGHEDYILWLNILKDWEAGLYPGWSVLGINEPLAFYRLHENSFSASKKKVALYQWVIYRRCENIGLVKSIYYFANYMVRGILKHKKLNLKGEGVAF